MSLALSLGEFDSARRFLVSAERLPYEVVGADDLARQYGFVNWQGGVTSGARYAFRALKAPIQQVCLHELRGQLGSGDVWAVSSAAALAVARLLGRSEVPLDLHGWNVAEEVRRPQEEGTSQGARSVSSQPESPPQRGEKGSPAIGITDTDQARQAIPAEPGAAADPPPD